jgi:hypothetical protein
MTVQTSNMALLFTLAKPFANGGIVWSGSKLENLSAVVVLRPEGYRADGILTTDQSCTSYSGRSLRNLR